MNSLKFKGLLILWACLITYISSAQALTPAQIDKVVERSMKTFDVPGMAVAVLKDGKIVSEKGYGIQSIRTEKPVDTQTMFGVASNTKAFTTAALAQLVDKGRLKWDDKVTDFIPEFQLYDPWVTREFTVRDLLTHRSGLGLGAGDLMVIPASNTTTLGEMIHNTRYLKPVSSFRSKYDYDNLLYIIAGEIVHRISGESYESYITNHILKPLGMNRSSLNIAAIKKDNNRIDGHAPVEGKLKITPRTFTPISLPAAGLYASVEDMAKWVQTRLDYGRYGEGLKDSLFSKTQAKEIWTPQTIVPTGKGNYNTHFQAYGLGWFLKDVNGYLMATHTGGLFGIVSEITLIPEMDLGIVVLTNQQSGAAFRAVTNSILDGYFGIKGKDRVAELNKRRLKSEKSAEKVTREVKTRIAAELKEHKGGTAMASAVIGNYEDPWYGEVRIVKQKGNKLRFTSVKSPEMVGNMQFYKGTTYVLQLDDQSLGANAFVNFSLDEEGKASGFTMKKVSPLTDFSFDYQDLHFTRIED